jgi:opacity protein-like surface antigen
MKRTVVGIIAALGIVSIGSSADAQSAATPRFEVSALLGGATFFTEGDNKQPSFVNYALVGSATFNVNRFVGVEGEFGGNIGFDQDLDFPAGTSSVKPPHMVSYSGNVIAHLGGRDRRVVPYVTGGIGGLTVLDRLEVGVPDNTTLLTGNVGGGVKANVGQHWGVRADYRFTAVRSMDDAPVFFGIENRYGHRIAGGLVFTFGN